MARWFEHKEFSTGLLRLYTLYYIYKILGRRVLKFIVFFIILFSYPFLKKARLASGLYFSNLYAYTGDKTYRPRFKNHFKHVYTFAKALVDKVASWSDGLKPSELHYATPKDLEKYHKQVLYGKGVFVLCSHLGNIEILRALMTKEYKDVHINSFMDMDQSATFNDFIKRVSPDAHINLYSTRDIGLDTACMTKDKLDDGEVIVMAADRVSAANDKKFIALPFLGETAHFPVGVFHFLKAMRTDFCFIAICLNSKTGKYDVHLKFFEKSEAKDMSSVSKKYAKWLENLTVQYPYQWFNFFDFWENR